MSVPSTAARESNNPFVGPRSIETGQKIYGRDAEIEALYYQLSADRLVLLYSPSGAGKSSLIQAGLIPRLQRRFAVWGPMRVNHAPDESTRAANRYTLSTKLGIDKDAPPVDFSSEVSLSEFVARRRQRSSEPEDPRSATAATQKNVVLIFDQFEEVLTSDPLDSEAKAAFFRELGSLLQADASLWALFVIREDFLAPLDPYCNALPTHLKSRLRIDLLAKPQAQEAILGLAESGVPSRGFSTPAIDGLIGDLSTVKIQQPGGKIISAQGHFVEPLHLQVVCRNLWERLQPEQAIIEEADVTAFGDVTQALAGYYAQQVAAIARAAYIDQKQDTNRPFPRFEELMRLSPDFHERQISYAERRIRDWVGRLITPTGTRSQVQLGEGETGDLDNETEVERLLRSHLIRGEKRAGATWYELSHDRLIEPVKADNRRWLEAILSPLQKQAALWAQQGEPGRLLFLDDELKAAEKGSDAPGLDAIEKKFLSASQAAQKILDRERKQAARLRLWLRLVLAALGLFIVALGFSVHMYREAKNKEREASQARCEAVKSREAAISSEHRANRQHSQALVAAAQETMDRLGGPGLALGSLSFALQLDPVSIGARAWIADLLQHKSWWLPRKSFDASQPIVLSALSPDGQHVLTVSWPGKGFINGAGSLFEAIVWDAETGKRLLDPIPIDTPPQRAAFSPDSKRFFTASGSNLAVYDIVRQKQILTVSMGQRIRYATFSHDGNKIAAASSDHTAKIWNLQQGGAVITLQHKGPVNTVEFSPDSKWVVTASEDKTAMVWNAETGNPAMEPISGDILGHSIRTARFNREGNQIVVTSGAVAYVRPLTAIAGNGTFRFKAAEVFSFDALDTQITDALFLPGDDGKARVLLLSQDKAARIWDAGRDADFQRCEMKTAAQKTGQCKEALGFSYHDWSIPGHAQTGTILPLTGSSTFAAVSEDGSRMVTADTNNTVQVWNGQGKMLGQPIPHTSRVSSLGIGPAGEILTTSAGSTSAEIWMLDGSEAAKLARNPLAGSEDSPRTVGIAATRAGLRAIQIDPRRHLTALLGQGGLPIGQPAHGLPDLTISGDLSPDAKRAISSDESFHSRLYDTATWKPVGGPLPSAVGNEFSSDGQRFLLINRENYELSGSKPLPPFSMQVYDAATGAAFPLIRLRAKFNNAHLSPDGQSVVSFSDNEIQFWNAATGERCAAQLPVARGAKEVALSLDGSLLALASAYQSVTVYRLQPMGRLTSFEISSPISALAFSPDNSKLVVGTEDGLDQIWDVKTGKPLSYPMNTGAATDTIAFSRDGKIVLTTSLHSAQIWETSDGNALGSPINVPDPANIDQTSIPLLAALSPDGRELWLAEFGGPLEIHHLLLGGDLGMDHDPVENLAILVSGFQAPANGDTVLERIAPRERLAMAEEFRKQFNIPQDQDLIPAMVKILAARK